jgi:hypothetical protein
MDIYGRKASLLKNSSPAGKKISKNTYSIVVSDNREFLESHNGGVLKIFFNQRIFSRLDAVTPNDLFYPLLLHPDYLLPNIEKDLATNAVNNNRRIAALFVGNVDPDYDRDITRKLFGVNTRRETFSCLEDSMGGGVYIPPSMGEFLRKIDAGDLSAKAVLIDIRNFRVPNNLWFKILLDSDFFIHMCGSLQPYCHNQIESMAAGCIPVTQLSRFFVPPFRDKIDALTFEKLGELPALMRGILNGEYKKAIPAMRERVLGYYKNHYSFRSFERKLNFLKENGIDFSNYYPHCEEVSILNELIEKDQRNLPGV